ncbi:hypothetical protein SEA_PINEAPPLEPIZZA_18 [Microbacterium phage PineapplePizza]|uniref:Uncharacterized protein n=1 Tax=Microbacterium phage PineapplePizza TaxID=2927268 RepID=A0A976U8D2_9CAUD|nr:hypothetical protein QEH41_gp18 [Microbacterium phage PineapplePizza]UVF60426.1 hypothetical protein SEA_PINEAPPLEPIZZA_18 [Microbacterium phage PineapplePizza]
MTNRNLPRNVAPELIREGDTVSVTYPEDKGIQTIKRGMVARIAVHGALRNLVTMEGSVLGVFAPGMHAGHVVFTLLDRPAVAQEPLSLFSDVLERT